MELLSNFSALFMEAAPWLLLGLLIAGLIKVFVPTQTLSKHMGGNDLKSVVKAAFIGAPLPLCSCGVLPAALGLRRAGASKSATVSFLVATPETGVDSVSVSYALLGPFMAIVRPIAAIISAIVAGVLVGKEETNTKAKESKASTTCCSSKKNDDLLPSYKPVKTQASTCCSSNTNTALEAKPITEKASCCSSSIETQPQKKFTCCGSTQAPSAVEGFKQKVVQALQFSSYDLIKDTQLWLLIGLFFAALVQTFLPSDFLAQYGHGVIAMVAMMIVGIPMYICATASTPIAAGLMMAGISPGAALVFMLAGPATNIAALGLVLTELGKRALFAYLTGVIGSAIIIGLLVDTIAESFNIVPTVHLAEHGLLPHWFMVASSLLLIGLMLRVVYKKVMK